MTYELIQKILKELGITYTYYQFKGPVKSPKYIAYYEISKNPEYADDKVYHFEPSFAVELYTKDKDVATENKLIALFAKYEVPWDGGVSTYIDTEKVYETVFYV